MFRHGYDGEGRQYDLQGRITDYVYIFKIITMDSSNSNFLIKLNLHSVEV